MNPPPPPAAVSSQEQVDYESKNESFIGEWSDDEEEEEEGETEEAGSGRVVTQSSRTRKQYAETIHVSVPVRKKITQFYSWKLNIGVLGQIL